MYKRIYLSFFCLAIVFGILISNLGVIILNTSNSPVSQNRSVKSQILDTSRGMIYDCHMRKIVNSVTENLTVCLPSTDALDIVKDYLDEDEQKNIYNRMSNGEISILRLPKKFNENVIKTVTVADRYSKNQPCVHLIGHLDENGEGAMGLEKVYNNYLKDCKGTVKAIWSADALGNILWGNGIDFESDNYLSPAGIQLTIDLKIQEIAEKALLNHNITKGAAVILNANTNEILASVSLPTFNPLNLSDALNSTDSPFINRTLTPYSIGSVFKPFIACTAIENNISFTYNCTGSINIGGTIFRCNNNIAHGFVTMTTAMEESCNTYFIALGQKIRVDNLISLCSDFGIGKELELADDFYLKSGKLPNAEMLNSPQAVANFSFGQGELLASPLQMAVAYSCFVNGGYYRPPTLMKAIIDDNGNAVQKVELPKNYRILNESTVNQIDNILEKVVKNGNGNRAFSEITKNHGKTATAQSGWYNDGTEITHTWFCGYFQFENTKYTVVIFKEDGKSGAVDCAPVFKEISEEIAKIKTVTNQ